MPKFITGKELDDAISDIIFNAQKCLLIVSPFIKLDKYFKQLFDNHSRNPELRIMIMFGKNEDNPKRSFSKEDFEYFKKFLDITVVYVPNLHAKYYGNEREGVITSINLYDYSFKNNIEFGVLSQSSFVDSFKDSFDTQAWDYCNSLFEQNDVILAKRPVYQKKFLGLTKNFMGSEVLFDATDQLLGGRKYESKRLSEFPESLEFGKPQYQERPQREEVTATQKIHKQEKVTIKADLTGYCIRTGVQIPFDPNKPMSYDAYKIWAEYSNPDYPEKYCHRTGKASHGKTSMRKPVLDRV